MDFLHCRSVWPLTAALVACGWAGAGAIAQAGDVSESMRDAERGQRIAELKAQRDRIREELSRLTQAPEGLSHSAVPQSELTNQPTRSLKESLESVPGAAPRPGSTARETPPSIRGGGK